MNLKIIDEDFRLVDIDEVPENYAPISNVVFFIYHQRIGSYST